MTDAPLVSVENLTVRFGSGRRPAVANVSFSLGRGRLGLVGESGSGKSMTAKALMGLLPSAAKLTADRLDFEGQSLLGFSPRDWAAFRGRSAGLVLQDPKFALDPVMRIGRQVEETLKLHLNLGKAERRERVETILEAVGLPDPRRVMMSFPHELSGGMGQRVMIASVLVAEPRLLIADEPTSALDQGLRDQILDLIVSLTESRSMGLVLISHDLEQVARYCDEALVMYQGQVVDRGAARDLPHSTHPYTSALWSCRPSAATRGRPLPTFDRTQLEIQP
ncbi:ABC transporter ATP-binding protein [Oryzibacter oryziterrae]|uniref:ABC transporter ATP-binding protein n=1 Tax=Oryzibacter oryziterrae TaxID=2766474 RepID=UPI001F39BF7A|nr:ABC transporter ATP-binding protein [Oryzibacter oryziterrae]